MVTLTENAATEVRKVIKENELPPETGVRLGIKGGGCAGFTYVFDFDNKPSDFDYVFESQGLKVMVDRKSHIYIDGVVVDFKTELTNRGFKFDNPKADAACGCGTSFLPKQATLT